MRTGRPIPPLTLTDTERETLERWARRAKTAQAVAQRARLILGCAAGRTNTVVAHELRLTKQTVGKWRSRFLARRLDGLLDRSGTPPQGPPLARPGPSPVLYLGVLYRMQNPFEALKRLAKVTRELAIIETEAIVVPTFEHLAPREFYDKDELQDDRSNWWIATEKALVGMCRAAGFRRVDGLTTPPGAPPGVEAAQLPGPLHYRAIAHAKGDGDARSG